MTMNKEIRDRLNALPDYVRQSSLSEKTADAIGLVREEYIGRDLVKLDILKNIIGLTFLKDTKLENLFSEIKNQFALNDNIAKEITLIILTKMLYPTKDFFPGIDDVIVQLGGEIPKGEAAISFAEQFTKREAEIEEMQRQEDEAQEQTMSVTPFYGKISQLLLQFPELGEQTIGSQQSIEVKNLPVPMKPMIKYWINDYKEKTGYGNHSNLERVQYVCHDKNTRNMNSEERRQLMLILKSADGEVDLPYSPRIKKIDFSLLKEE
jgi:hypothetical protein